MKKRIVIVGGGAAGMMAAIAAAEEGADVLILEHNDKVGKKILSTGNGRCNFTNRDQKPEYYRSEQKDFPWQVVSRYPAERVEAAFAEMGIYAKDKNGYLYPFSEQASAVLDVLRMELERRKVRVLCGEHVKEIRRGKQSGGAFSVLTRNADKKENVYSADAVILTTGSKAASKLGSDGSGYDLAMRLGHHIAPVVPALVQLKCKESFYKALAGVRVHGKVTVFVGGKELGCDTGEIQLTNYGISGIPVFQISRFAARGIYEKKEVRAVLDFIPDMTDGEFQEFLKTRIQLHPEREMEDFFTGLFHKKLSGVILKNAGIPLKKRAGELSEKEAGSLGRAVKEFRTVVTDTNPFEQAQVCAGGVRCDEVNPETMESYLVKGLYFAGEVLDVDGICGGYNLQWAWSSGYLAGKGAAHA